MHVAAPSKFNLLQQFWGRCEPERVLLKLGSPVARFVILRERPRIT
jgi:hypothetical protein